MLHESSLDVNFQSTVIIEKTGEEHSKGNKRIYMSLFNYVQSNICH